MPPARPTLLSPNRFAEFVVESQNAILEYNWGREWLRCNCS
jgi:hypothetical protein